LINFYIYNLLLYYNITIGDLVGPLAVAPEQFTLKRVAGIRAAMLASSANGPSPGPAKATAATAAAPRELYNVHSVGHSVINAEPARLPSQAATAATAASFTVVLAHILGRLIDFEGEFRQLL
jgi:hypothetical protein